MKRSWTFSVLGPLLLIMVGVGSCDRILRTVRGGAGDRTVEPISDRSAEQRVGTQSLTTDNVLVNETAGISIELPNSWSSTEGLHNSAELQAADPEQQLYLVVVAEDADALRRLSLEEVSANYRKLLADQLAVYEGASETDVAFVGTNYASQYEMRGRLQNGTPVVYLHTTVVGDENYYQVVAWTTPEQYEAYRSELQTITETFRETGS